MFYPIRTAPAMARRRPGYQNKGPASSAIALEAIAYKANYSYWCGLMNPINTLT